MSIFRFTLTFHSKLGCQHLRQVVHGSLARIVAELKSGK